MDAAKVRLSKEEMALVSQPGWILTKNSIMARAVTLMAGLSERMAPELERMREQLDDLAGNCDTPKISKGENYLGLPYVMLDYPRLFGREDVLAIRTMFWWGNYFSVTLHLKGRYQALFLPVIQQHLPGLAAAGYHIAFSDDEWRHEMTADNYKPLEDILTGHPFLKLSAKCGLDKWNEAPEILLDLYRVLVRALEG